MRLRPNSVSCKEKVSSSFAADAYLRGFAAGGPKCLPGCSYCFSRPRGTSVKGEVQELAVDQSCQVRKALLQQSPVIAPSQSVASTESNLPPSSPPLSSPSIPPLRSPGVPPLILRSPQDVSRLLPPHSHPIHLLPHPSRSSPSLLRAIRLLGRLNPQRPEIRWGAGMAQHGMVDEYGRLFNRQCRAGAKAVGICGIRVRRCRLGCSPWERGVARCAWADNS